MHLAILNSHNRISAEAGVTLIELLVAFAIFSVIALAFTFNSSQAHRTIDHSNRHAGMQQLAIEKIEELSAINPILLNDTYDDTESDLDIDGIEYERITDITINANGSRTIDVTINAENSSRATQFTLSHTISLWGAV
ncbi:MAG: prepilin-type N-terminal cleavage/methylation domain-containing protein [Bdellovibrionales bacterium]|nr:prepilin-type N-terminal cleavage/methylation domain-containing protein [Bdellovibrionales bacterium]